MMTTLNHNARMEILEVIQNNNFELNIMFVEFYGNGNSLDKETMLCINNLQNKKS